MGGHRQFGLAVCTFHLGFSLVRMLQEGRPEDEHLDYKDKRSLLPTLRGRQRIDKDRRADDISKDVSSFLNSDGGVLVYGVPESTEEGVTGGSPAEGAGEIGFLRGEIDKETIEDLVTSNIQPKPGPELFHVTEVPYGDDGRIVFIIEVAVGFGDVWQARDKRYYKRFHYKAEPMEHYEINMVRERNSGPDLGLTFGLNDRWDTSLVNEALFGRANTEIQIHVGITNARNTIPESVFIELAFYLTNNEQLWTQINIDKTFPLDLFPDPFEPIGLRDVEWTPTADGSSPRTAKVPLAYLSWNGFNPKLAGRYTPIFKTEQPLPVTRLSCKGLSISRLTQIGLAYIFWRLQAPSMRPRHGVVELDSSLYGPHLVCMQTDWETK